MTQFLDIDAVELRARTCLESGAGTIDPQTVLELVRLLRAGNKAIGAGVLVAAPIDNERTESVGGFPQKFAANVGALLHPEPKPLSLAFAEEPDACSCDESLSLRARIAELKARQTLNRRHPDAAPTHGEIAQRTEMLFCFAFSDVPFGHLGIGFRHEDGKWQEDGNGDEPIEHECVRWWIPTYELLATETGATSPKVDGGPADQRAERLLGAFLRKHPGWSYHPLWRQSGTSGTQFCCELQGPEEMDGEHEGRGPTEADAIFDAVRKAEANG